MPHSSGFTPTTGGLRIPAWGVGVGQGGGQGGKSSAENDSARCAHYSETKVTERWGTGVPRAPSRVSKRRPLAFLSGFGRKKPSLQVQQKLLKSIRGHNEL